MYWPIGAPRIYAAGSSQATHRTLEFDDNAESRETTEDSGSLVDVYGLGTDLKPDDGQDATSAGISTPMTPVTPGIRPVEHDGQRRSFPFNSQDISFSGSADTEPLLSLKISRTGHLFAVITSTSLTIWQTKARVLFLNSNNANTSHSRPLS
jgi:hypothetical protein